MDPVRFDTLVKSVATAASSRRQLLTGVAGSALGALAVRLAFREAGATHFGCFDVGQHCKAKSECCSSRCRRGRCRAHHVGRCTVGKDTCVTGIPGCGNGRCNCYLTTGGAYFCSSGEGQCMACTTDAECAEALHTPGAACIDVNHGNCSCSSLTTYCAMPCPK
jgi:hypothetical protein